ncbi:TrmB family transcriptional regulator [Patescibacteria group bacterium]
MEDLKNVVSMLQHFGLSSREANAYLACLELGPSSIQQISKHSTMNRSTVHFLAESLKKKGLFGETCKGKKRLIFAVKPEDFVKLVNKERDHVNLMETSLEDLLPLLQNISCAESNRPKVMFYEGEKGFYDICNRSIKHSTNKEILFLSSLDDFRNVGNDEEYDEEDYIPNRVKKGIHIKMLVFENRISQNFRIAQAKELREVRFLPDDFKFKSTFFIYGDEFSMVSSKPPFLGIVIQSKQLSHTMKQIFEMLWAVGK